jgi:hypothetical protein
VGVSKKIIAARSHLVVGCIDENLIKDLEESGNKGSISEIVWRQPPRCLAIEYCSPHRHHFRFRVKDPHHLSDCLDRPNIGIWPFENMLELRELQWGSEMSGQSHRLQD